MLLREYGRRAQHHDLSAILDGLERRADGNLRLAVSHVAAHEAVHGLRRFHIRLDISDGLRLVARLLIREERLHLPLHVVVGRIGVAGDGRAPHVEVDEVERQLLGGLRRTGLGTRPIARVQTRELGFLAPRSHVLRNLRYLLDGDEELVTRRVLEHQIVPPDAVDLLLLHAREIGDTVLLVNDVVARLVREGDGGLLAALWHARSLGDGGDRIVRVEQREMSYGNDDGRGNWSVDDIRDILAQVSHGVSRRFDDGDVLVDELGLHLLAQAAVADADHDGVALSDQAAHLRDEALVGVRALGALGHELTIRRASGMDEREDGQRLHVGEAQLGRRGVEAIELRLGAVRLGVQLVVEARRIIEQRAWLDDYGERAGMEEVERAARAVAQERQILLLPTMHPEFRDGVELGLELVGEDAGERETVTGLAHVGTREQRLARRVDAGDVDI